MIYERKNSTENLNEGISIRIGKEAPDEFIKFAVELYSKINKNAPLKNADFKNEILKKKSMNYYFEIKKQNVDRMKAFGHDMLLSPDRIKANNKKDEETRKLIKLIERCGVTTRSKNPYNMVERYTFSKDKKYIFEVWPTVVMSGNYYGDYGIHVKCISNNTRNRRKHVLECEGVENKNITIMRHNHAGKPVIETGFDSMVDPVDAMFFDKDPLRDMKSTPDLHSYMSYPTAVGEKINEYFDLSDTATRHSFLNEATAESVLTSLTNRLYDHIVRKTTSIDYGTIPQTKGDITKLPMYDDLKDVCGIIKGIVEDYGEKGGPIDTVTLAMANVETRKDLFTRAYRADCELPIILYENTVLGIVNATSYLIAACIELIKAPSDETYRIQLDKLAYNKSRDHLLYTTLDKFNKACEKGDVDKAVNAVIDQRVRKFTGTAMAAIGIGVIGIVIIMNIIPILRELVYTFYYTKVKISDFFDIQADLLQMNAYNVEGNGAIDAEQRKEIARKQRDIAEHFRSIANKMQIDSKQSEVKASREIQANKRKYKVDDITNEDIEDDGEEGVSSLF